MMLVVFPGLLLRKFDMDLKWWFLASFSLFRILLPISSQESLSNPYTCPENFECGSLGPLKFPYTSRSDFACGFCMLDCNLKPSPQITFQLLQEKWFEVKSITNSTIKLYDPVLEDHLKYRNCTFLQDNTTLPRYPSIAFTILNNITLFRCNKDPETSNKAAEYFSPYKYYNGCDKFTIYFTLPNDQTPAVSIPSGCTSILLPAVPLYNKENPALLDLLTAEFDVQWHLSGDCYDCYHEGQTCRTEWSEGLGLRCGNAKKGKKNSKVSLGKGKAWIWIVVASSSVLVILLLGLLWYLRVKHIRKEMEERLQDEYIHQLTESDGFNNINEVGNTAREPHDMKIFSFGSIMAATDDFSSENKLGEGGFGPVYRGKLLDGREIAVKRLSRTSGQGLVEYKNELILISKLQHTNLVRVLGCCIRGDERMLIYEYMPNKSLDFFLFAEDKKKLLDWQKRFNIIEGIAQGLLYLHKYSRVRVIHRDLKASNVLLDENLNPKIADFGMARIFKQNETEAKTNRVVGTYGYMSPEYAMEGAFSVKSDVFSFGVLILEIVTGRKNMNLYNLDDHQLNLIGYTWMLWKEGVALDLKDPALGNSCDIKQLLRSVHVGLLCVQENAMDRPSMSEVISMLSSGTMPSLAPKQPAFFTGRRALDLTSSEIKSTGNPADNLHISTNELSISVLEAR